MLILFSIFFIAAILLFWYIYKDEIDKLYYLKKFPYISLRFNILLKFIYAFLFMIATFLGHGNKLVRNEEEEGEEEGNSNDTSDINFYNTKKLLTFILLFFVTVFTFIIILAIVTAFTQL